MLASAQRSSTAHFPSSLDQETPDFELNTTVMNDSEMTNIEFEAINETKKRKLCAHHDLPMFEFIPELLSNNEIDSIRDYAASGLGDDPSSKHFILRKKAIAFVLIIGDNVYSLSQDYFVQAETYNDFSGGYRRYYTKISDDILQKSLKRSILHFAKYWDLPDRSVLLVQVQRSIIDPIEQAPDNSSEKLFVNGKNDVTGQGVHTDGSDRAMLVCCERDNVLGAENCFHGSLSGDQPLCEPRVLAEGDAACFKDNSIYHCVSDAFPADPSKKMNRTMVLMHYPGEIYLDGAKNPKNNQSTRLSTLNLRNVSST